MADSARLYERVLGDAWPRLGEPVRRLHHGNVRALGTFKVVHGRSFLCRLLARLFRLPPEGPAVPIELNIVATEQGEEWRRLFGTHKFTSRQWESGGQLMETAGPIRIRMQLTEVDGALHYEVLGRALRLGLFYLPLPRWLGPSGQAWEKPANGDGVQVFVEMTVPLLGRLVAYEGTLARIDAGAT